MAESPVIRNPLPAPAIVGRDTMGGIAARFGALMLASKFTARRKVGDMLISIGVGSAAPIPNMYLSFIRIINTTVETLIEFRADTREIHSKAFMTSFDQIHQTYKLNLKVLDEPAYANITKDFQLIPTPDFVSLKLCPLPSLFEALATTATQLYTCCVAEKVRVHHEDETVRPGDDASQDYLKCHEQLFPLSMLNNDTGVTLQPFLKLCLETTTPNVDDTFTHWFKLNTTALFIGALTMAVLEDIRPISNECQSFEIKSKASQSNPSVGFDAQQKTILALPIAVGNHLQTEFTTVIQDGEYLADMLESYGVWPPSYGVFAGAEGVVDVAFPNAVKLLKSSNGPPVHYIPFEIFSMEPFTDIDDMHIYRDEGGLEIIHPALAKAMSASDITNHARELLKTRILESDATIAMMKLAIRNPPQDKNSPTVDDLTRELQRNIATQKARTAELVRFDSIVAAAAMTEDMPRGGGPHIKSLRQPTASLFARPIISVEFAEINVEIDERVKVIDALMAHAEEKAKAVVEMEERLKVIEKSDVITAADLDDADEAPVKIVPKGKSPAVASVRSFSVHSAPRRLALILAFCRLPRLPPRRKPPRPSTLPLQLPQLPPQHSLRPRRNSLPRP